MHSPGMKIMSQLGAIRILNKAKLIRLTMWNRIGNMILLVLLRVFRPM